MTLAWQIVQHKPRLEIGAINDLAALGLQPFRPLCRLTDDAPPTPYFPGYVFARFDVDKPETGWTRLAQSPAILRPLISRQGLSEKLIGELMEAQVRGDGSIRLVDDASKQRRRMLVYGQPVRIEDGPFVGCVGYFDSYARRRIVVMLDMVKRALRLVLKENAVAPIEASRAFIRRRPVRPLNWS